MWALTWIGCGTVPLGEVPVVGGDEDQRDVVRGNLTAFDDAVGPGRVELRRVEIRALRDEEIAGVYRHGSRTILLDDDAPYLSGTVLHELGHALVHQDRLPVERGPMAEAGERVERRYATAEHPLDGPRDRGSEAVAMLVESGPSWAADHLRAACESPIPAPDPTLADAAARWLLEHVWRGFELPEPVQIDPAEIVEVDVIGFLPEAILPTADPRVVVVVSAAGAQVSLDVPTGELVADLPAVASHPRLPPGLGRWFATSAAADRDGRVLTTGNWVGAPVSDTSGMRVLAHDGDQWRFVGDGCAAADLVFPADGRLWLATMDGPLRWAPVP